MAKTKRSWKKILFGILAVLVGLMGIIAVGIIFWMQTWKTYINQTYDFSLRYPSNYLAAPLCDYTPDNEIMISTKKVNCEPGFTTDGKILMWVIVYEGDQTSKYLQTDTMNNPNWQVAKTETITLDGNSATKISLKNKQGDIREEVVVYIRNRTYRLTQLSESNFEADRKLFNQVLSTFKFIN